MTYSPLDDPNELPTTAFSRTAIGAPMFEPLRGESRADVVVIGGGFTGLSTALYLAEGGAKVALVEACDIGWGASGRALAQVPPYLKHGPDHALRTLGSVYGKRIVDAAADGTDLLFDLAEQHSFQCEAVRNGLIFAAHAPTALPALQKRTAYWRERGARVEMLDASQTNRLIGGGYYWGASIDYRGGVINPLSYARELARVAASKGVAIYVRSRAQSFGRKGGKWRIELERGALAADHIAICTNAYTGQLWPEWRDSVVPIRSYAAVSKPLPEFVSKTILPGGQALTDTSRLVSGMRIYRDGRLHASVDAPRLGPESRPNLARLTRRVLRVFPQAAGLEWEHYWSGWIAMTADMYPCLVRSSDGVIAGGGYSGRGMALSLVMGREIARHILGTPAEDLLFRVEEPRRLPLRPLAELAVNGLIAVKRIQDAIDVARYWKPHQ